MIRFIQKTIYDNFCTRCGKWLFGKKFISQNIGGLDLNFCTEDCKSSFTRTYDTFRDFYNTWKNVVTIDGERVFVNEKIKKIVDEYNEYKRIAEGRPPQVLLEYIRDLHGKYYELLGKNKDGSINR